MSLFLRCAWPTNEIGTWHGQVLTISLAAYQIEAGFPFVHGTIDIMLLCSLCRSTGILLCIIGSIGTRAQDLFYHGVEGVTGRTLNTQKVPIASMTLGFTIVAHDINHTLQISRHGVFGNVSCSCLPRGCHGLLRHDRLFANGATVIKSGQLAKAMGMNGMSTRQILW